MGKWILAALMGAMAYFNPIADWFVIATGLIFLDFCTGNIASYCEHKRRGKPWKFRAVKARQTIIKMWWACFVIGTAFVIEMHYVEAHKHTITIAAFISGIEAYSALIENVDRASDGKIGLLKVVRMFVETYLKKSVPENVMNEAKRVFKKEE